MGDVCPLLCWNFGGNHKLWGSLGGSVIVLLLQRIISNVLNLLSSNTSRQLGSLLLMCKLAMKKNENETIWLSQLAMIPTALVVKAKAKQLPIYEALLQCLEAGTGWKEMRRLWQSEWNRWELAGFTGCDVKRLTCTYLYVSVGFIHL